MPDLPPLPSNWKRPASWQELSLWQGQQIKIGHAEDFDSPVWQKVRLLYVETGLGKARLATVRLPGGSSMEVLSLKAFAIPGSRAEERQSRRLG